MAKFSISKENPFVPMEYTAVLKVHDLFMDVLDEHFVEGEASLTDGFEFFLGDLSCSCENRTEFIREAFGQNNFRFKGVNAYLRKEYEHICGLFIYGFESKITISANDKKIIADVITIYERRLKALQDGQNIEVPIQHIDNSTHLHLSGSVLNNSIVGNNVESATIQDATTINDSPVDNSTNTTTFTNSPVISIEKSSVNGAVLSNSTITSASSSKPSFWSKIRESIAEKAIWWLLGLIGALILSWFGFNAL